MALVRGWRAAGFSASSSLAFTAAAWAFSAACLCFRTTAFTRAACRALSLATAFAAAFLLERRGWSAASIEAADSATATKTAKNPATGTERLMSIEVPSASRDLFLPGKVTAAKGTMFGTLIATDLR